MSGDVWGLVRQAGTRGVCQQGEIPVVDQYKYLGLTLDHQFSLATIIRDRVTPLREKSIRSVAATPMIFWTDASFSRYLKANGLSFEQALANPDLFVSLVALRMGLASNESSQGLDGHWLT